MLGERLGEVATDTQDVSHAGTEQIREVMRGTHGTEEHTAVGGGWWKHLNGAIVAS